ncbi:TPA: DUF551 domain-containing protein [Escherichia coli]|nr:DUF551 domain-containing protein [Escherichia coli]
MTTITKERIELFIKNPLDNGLTRGEQMELARIALASLEAEPVGAFHIAEQQVDGTSDYLKDGEWPIDNGIIEVYAAPPVLVVPAALPENDDEDGHDIDYLEPSEVYSLGRTAGWNACRAAMLHGAEPVSQTYNLPQTHFEQVADLYEMQFDDGRTCAFHTDAQKAAQWLRACDGNRVQEYVKLERLQNAISGNSPVIPDGWISCSERMPDKLIPVMVMYEDGEMWSAMWNGNRWDDGTEYPDPHSVTHWREMPAAPQQEVK